MVKELKKLIAQKELISSQITKEINKIIDITFDNLTDGRTPFKARSSPGFSDYFNTIWKELVQ